MNFQLFSVGVFLLIIAASSIPLISADSKVAVIETKFGKMVMEFFPNDAPKTVANFMNLTENGFYDGTKFHRIIPGFMIQGGDPQTRDNSLMQKWGTGGSNSTVPAEFNTIKHLRGIVSMARAYDPNSASSQFFIVHKDSPFLDKQYTVFGRLVTKESFDVLDSIANLETNKNGTNGIPKDSPLDLDSAQIKSIKIANLSDIPDVLNPGPPERMISYSTIENGVYSNTKLEFSFKAPDGWTMQEPAKVQLGTPDVVALGPRNDDFNSVIAFLVEDKNNTSLDQYVKESRKNLQPLIEQGRLKILSDKVDKLKGFDAQVTEAKGSFTSGQKLFVILYKEYVVDSGSKFYTITYTNEEKDFDSGLKSFDNVIDSLKITGEKTEVEPYTPSETNIPAVSNVGMNNVIIGIGVAIAAAVGVAVFWKIKKKPSTQNLESSKSS